MTNYYDKEITENINKGLIRGGPRVTVAYHCTGCRWAVYDSERWNCANPSVIAEYGEAQYTGGYADRWCPYREGDGE